MNDPIINTAIIAVGVFLGAAGNSMVNRFIDWRRNVAIDRRTRKRAKKDQMKMLKCSIESIWERLHEMEQPRKPK